MPVMLYTIQPPAELLIVPCLCNVGDAVAELRFEASYVHFGPRRQTSEARLA